MTEYMETRNAGERRKDELRADRWNLEVFLPGKISVIQDFENNKSISSETSKIVSEFEAVFNANDDSKGPLLDGNMLNQLGQKNSRSDSAIEINPKSEVQVFLSKLSKETFKFIEKNIVNFPSAESGWFVLEEVLTQIQILKADLGVVEPYRAVTALASVMKNLGRVVEGRTGVLDTDQQRCDYSIAIAAQLIKETLDGMGEIEQGTKNNISAHSIKLLSEISGYSSDKKEEDMFRIKSNETLQSIGTGLLKVVIGDVIRDDNALMKPLSSKEHLETSKFSREVGSKERNALGTYVANFRAHKAFLEDYSITSNKAGIYYESAIGVGSIPFTFSIMAYLCGGESILNDLNGSEEERKLAIPRFLNKYFNKLDEDDTFSSIDIKDRGVFFKWFYPEGTMIEQSHSDMGEDMDDMKEKFSPDSNKPLIGREEIASQLDLIINSMWHPVNGQVASYLKEVNIKPDKSYTSNDIAKVIVKMHELLDGVEINDRDELEKKVEEKVGELPNEIGKDNLMLVLTLCLEKKVGNMDLMLRNLKNLSSPCLDYIKEPALEFSSKLNIEERMCDMVVFLDELKRGDFLKNDTPSLTDPATT